jgi:pimeloyl-ACP methyl ester carboxylesterase
VVPELSALGGTAGPTAGLDVGTGARVAGRLAERLLPGRRPTVAGLSLGGWMAVRLGLERPELPARLLIVDGGGYLDQDWERIERTVRVDSTEGVERLYDALFEHTPWTLRSCKRTFLHAYGSTAVRAVLDALDDEALASLHVPTGLIWRAILLPYMRCCDERAHTDYQRPTGHGRQAMHPRASRDRWNHRGSRGRRPIQGRDPRALPVPRGARYC